MQTFLHRETLCSNWELMGRINLETIYSCLEEKVRSYALFFKTKCVNRINHTCTHIRMNAHKRSPPTHTCITYTPKATFLDWPTFRESLEGSHSPLNIEILSLRDLLILLEMTDHKVRVVEIVMRTSYLRRCQLFPHWIWVICVKKIPS